MLQRKNGKHKRYLSGKVEKEERNNTLSGLFGYQ